MQGLKTPRPYGLHGNSGSSLCTRSTDAGHQSNFLWPKGVVQRMRTGRRMRTRRCSRLSAGVTVLPMGVSVARTYLNGQDLVLGQKSPIFALQFG